VLIVISGFPRSGSTLLYNMLRTTVVGFDFYEREWPAMKALEDCAQDGRHRISKRPMDIISARDIEARARELNVRMYFVLTFRDPRGVLTSIHANSEGRYKVNWDYSLKTSHKDGVCGRTPGLIENYRACRACWERKGGNPPVVFYEDLVTDPDRVQWTLGGECALKYEGRFQDFHRTPPPDFLTHQMNGLRPVEPSRIDAWKEHPERVREQFEACPELNEVMEWLGALKTVRQNLYEMMKGA
jgi:hypothetical protein